jgi:hypothetical protein
VTRIPPVPGATPRAEHFATFTSADTLLVGRCDPSEDPAAAALDSLADQVRGTESGAGPLKVERIPMPPRRDGAWLTYTSAVFANDVVIVPTYAGVDDRLERDALDTYRRLLPGREILTVDSTSLAAAGATLRSVTLNVPHLGDARALDDAPAQPFPGGGDFPRPSRIDAFVSGGGWFGPRRSVLRMDV